MPFIKPPEAARHDREELCPADAVCRKVLNLLSQDGSLPGGSALAEAYRVRTARSRPFQRVLAQNRVMLHHGHSRAMILIP